MNFVFDCDGVLQDYCSIMDKIAFAKYRVRPKNAYAIEQRYPTLNAYARNVVHSRTGLQIHNLPEIDNAFSVLKALQADGHNVFVSTAIPEHLADSRLISFNKHGFTPTKLFCVGSNPKTQSYIDANADYMFDDQKRHLKEAEHIVQNRILIGNIVQKDDLELDAHEHYASVTQWYNEWKQK
jgi:hypothetical protein